MLDMACGWLARLPGAGIVFVALIPAAAVAFGVSYAVQWIVLAVMLWRPPIERRRREPGRA